MLFELLELTVRGLFLGVTIGLLALPISLLFLTTDSVDLAVGCYAVLSGALALMVGGTAGVVAGICGAVLASVVVALIALKLNRSPQQDPMMAVLGTFGGAIFLQSFVLMYYGQNAIVRQPFDFFWTLAGIRISPAAFVNLGVALAVLGGLTLALYATPFGRSMRASAINPLGATLAGVPVRKVWFATYVLGGLLAGVGGIFIMNTTGMDYSQGLGFTLGSFAAAILFGLKSPLRAFLGGIVMGIVEALSAGYISGAWATAVPFVFIFFVLSSGRMDSATTVGRRA